MRTNMLRFPSLLVAMVVMSTCLASWSIARLAGSPTLGDDTLAKFTGTNSTQTGTSGYTCQDAVVNSSNGVYISGAGCTGTPNGQLNPTDNKNKQ